MTTTTLNSMLIGQCKDAKIKLQSQKTTYRILKNQLLHIFNSKFCMGRVNHGQKTVFWFVDDHQEKFQPLLSISWFLKRNSKNPWIEENDKKLRFFFIRKVNLPSDSLTLPSTWRSHDSLIVNHVYSTVLSKISNFDW